MSSGQREVFARWSRNTNACVEGRDGEKKKKKEPEVGRSRGSPKRLVVSFALFLRIPGGQLFSTLKQQSRYKHVSELIKTNFIKEDI